MVLGTVEVAEDAADVVTGSFAVLLALSLCCRRIRTNAYLQAILMCGLCCFSPCHSPKQLLSFNPLKPLVSHQNMSLLKCNPLTSVLLLCFSYARVLRSVGSRVSEHAKGWKNLNIKVPR